MPERISTSRKGNGCRFLFLFLICSSWCQIRYQRPAAPWPGQETCWGLCQHLAKTIGLNHQAPDVSVAAGGLGQGMTMGEHSRGTSISETCLLRDAPSEAPHRHCTERFCWSFSHHPKLGAAPAGNLCLSAQVGQCEFNRPLPLRGQFYCALKGAVNMSRKFASEVFKEKEIPNWKCKHTWRFCLGKTLNPFLHQKMLQWQTFT